MSLHVLRAPFHLLVHVFHVTQTVLLVRVPPSISVLLAHHLDLYFRMVVAFLFVVRQSSLIRLVDLVNPVTVRARVVAVMAELIASAVLVIIIFYALDDVSRLLVKVELPL